MKIFKTAILVLTLAALTACGSAGQKQKNKADARYTEEKTKTMREYKSCLKKAKQDQDKLDACERLLKAVE